MACKCKKKACNCPSEPDCTPDCSCGGPIVAFSHERKTECKKSCSCNTMGSQLDTREVFYKGKQGCSNLEHLGIEKGADLESVIESFGRFISSFSYFDVRDNIYDAKDFTEFMSYLQDDMNLLRLEITNLCEKYENIQLSLNTINERLAKLEKPHIIDTRGLGFTVNDTIFKVLQKISDNG